MIRECFFEAFLTDPPILTLSPFFKCIIFVVIPVGSYTAHLISLLLEIIEKKTWPPFSMIGSYEIIPVIVPQV